MSPPIQRGSLIIQAEKKRFSQSWHPQNLIKNVPGLRLKPKKNKNKIAKRKSRPPLYPNNTHLAYPSTSSRTNAKTMYKKFTCEI